MDGAFGGLCVLIFFMLIAIILLGLPAYVIGYKESKFDKLDSTSRAMLGVVAGFCFIITLPLSVVTCGIMF